jgi:hypothetical protein
MEGNRMTDELCDCGVGRWEFYDPINCDPVIFCDGCGVKYKLEDLIRSYLAQKDMLELHGEKNDRRKT